MVRDLDGVRELRRRCRRRFPFLSEALQFGVVGGLGLLLDLAVYTASQPLLGLHHLTARLLAFCCATTQNWVLNRRFTFAHGQARPALTQWVSYLTVMAIGLAVNVGTYAALTARFHAGMTHRYVAFLVGVAAGTGVNFMAARSFVFTPPRAAAEVPDGSAPMPGGVDEVSAMPSRASLPRGHRSPPGLRRMRRRRRRHQGGSAHRR